MTFLRHSVKTDGKLPQIGDNDNGRVLYLREDQLHNNDPLLSIGSMLFNESFLKMSEYIPDEIFLHFGKLGADRFGKIEVGEYPSSKIFMDGGFAILRSEKDFVIACFTPVGISGHGSHSHNDKLSFVLNYSGEDIIIDPGTYTYTRYPKERNLFRSTQMHNTVRVNGEEQNRYLENYLFAMTEDANPRLLDYKLGEDEDLVVLEHQGYQRLNIPVLHERKLIFNKKNKYLYIEDLMKSNSKNLFEWFFHFGNNEVSTKVLNIEVLSNLSKKFNYTRHEIGMKELISIEIKTPLGNSVFLIPFEIDEDSISLRPSNYSNSYGEIDKGMSAVISSTCRGNFTQKFLIISNTSL